jgi:hypothetical protein
MMLKTIYRAFYTTLCILLAAVAAHAQGQAKTETAATATKLVVAKLKGGAGDTYEVRGRAMFTLVAANGDGSLVGTITYNIPDEARARIAQLTGKPVTQIPVRVIHKDVVATFQKATECPVLHLEFTPLDINVAGANLHFNRFVLDISEDGQRLNRLLCVVAKQLNANRTFRGPVKQINAILAGEEPDAQAQSQD